MCRISYEKCICFLFLVILAVLSCSGFRIDSLAMTDISNKRNSHTSSPSGLNGVEHKVRHQRYLRAATAAAPSERLARVPAAGPQPNSTPKTHQKRKQCPEHDITWKVFKSSIVVVARVESMSMNRTAALNYTVNFKVLRRLKSSTIPVDDTIRLMVVNKPSCMDYNNDFSEGHNRRPHQSLVRTQKVIEQSKEYILFLNTTSAHKFAATFEPEKIEKKHRKKNEPDKERKIKNIIKRFSSPSYTPKPVEFEKMNQTTNVPKNKLKIVCTLSKGSSPIPIIHWQHNEKLLHPNNRTRIIQKNEGKERRRSTLVIKNPVRGDSGNYKCSARGVYGKRNSTDYDIIIKVPCKVDLANTFCENGGTCFYEESMGENFCHCRENYTGTRCQEKKASNQSN